jgi:metal-responsive CopG/Arc/MetJ family transcriptional regulator
MAKVLVSLPDEFLRKVDREAKTQGRSRSDLIRDALRRLIGDRGESLPWRQAIAKMRWLRDEWTGRWNSTDVIRQERERRHGREDRR